MSTSPIVRRRIDGVYFFDAVESAGNGEPNDDGRPRQDPHTLHLWWNDAALKRFFRESIIDRHADAPGHRVLVQHEYPLNRCQTEALTALGHDVDDAVHADDDGGAKTKKGAKKNRITGDVKLEARNWIAREFQDVRWFGAVLDVGYQLGNITGPLQFQIARSVHPVDVLEGGVTRVTPTTEKDFANGKKREMGKKYVVPYALFRGRFCYTPSHGEKALFSVEDLRDFLDILKDPFRSRQSASLGMVTLRKAWIFLHEGPLGNEQLGILDDRVSVKPVADPPGHMRDFEIAFDDAGLAAKGIQVFTEETFDDLLAEVVAHPGKTR